MRLGFAAAFAAPVLLLSVIFFAGAAAAQSDLKAAPVVKVESQTLPDPVSPQVGFDAMKATNAYLGQLKGEARRKSDSYFEGGYVLLLVDALYAVVVSAILLWSKISAGMRNIAQRWTRSRFWQVPIYVVMYTVLVAVLTFPLTVYEDFFREHQYGLSNQNFMDWFSDANIILGVNLIAMTVLLTVIYAVVRAAPRTWWLWGALVTVAFLMLTATIAPVYVSPLLNHYQPLKESPLKEQILSVARAEGIPATNVYEFDASRQSKRVSANVSGMFGTTRISMTDNLIKRSTPDEIIAVLGHEMGHYVLNHVAILITWVGLLIFVAFAFVNWGFRFLAGIFGGNWDVRTIDDPAGLPLVMALVAIFSLLATPISNTITRTTEAQADIFGINAVRKPDGFAKAALMLGEYRKLDPSPWEEFVFFDHPSGRTRIYTAMRWKAEHLNDPDIKNGPVSPQ